MNNAHNNYNLCSVFNVTNAMETRKIKERGAGSEGQFVCTAGWEGSRGADKEGVVRTEVLGLLYGILS